LGLGSKLKIYWNFMIFETFGSIFNDFDRGPNQQQLQKHHLICDFLWFLEIFDSKNCHKKFRKNFEKLRKNIFKRLFEIDGRKGSVDEWHFFRPKKVPPGPEGGPKRHFVKITSLRVDTKYKFSKPWNFSSEKSFLSKFRKNFIKILQLFSKMIFTRKRLGDIKKSSNFRPKNGRF